MTRKCMSEIAREFSAITHYQVGSIRISRSTSAADHNSIVAGLTMWYGVVLDYNAMFCKEQEASLIRGRILKHARDGWRCNRATLQGFLESLDELGDLLLKHLSSSDGFKAHLFLSELKTWKVAAWLSSLKGVLLSIFSSAFLRSGEEDEVRAVRCVRQIACFLKKLAIGRPDLEDQMRKEFKTFETFLQSDVPQRSLSSEYQADVLAMRTILMDHMDEFRMDPFVPGHGPGAVADPLVDCWFAKHTSAARDLRVGYLLGHAGLGTEQDYLPFVGEKLSSRTSRYITVPKTWKKLRGISSEPAELQFWQQGVLRRLDAMFTADRWWARRINLHDQQRSRQLALVGSMTGDYATVDLSSASDSVTLQLVRDLFGNSKLARWLLGTRSTRTVCEGEVIEVMKFAPMGSACCFPTQCMIFCLAAEVAVSRTRRSHHKSGRVCVFGDDIIVPSYAVLELFAILDHLGFSVNSEKSFWTGDFREACGAEAWRGHDIAPCRFQAWISGVRGRYSDYDEISALISFANELYRRGLHDTREFLLGSLFAERVRLGGSQSMKVQDTIFATFTGEGQSLASPFPTNFNLGRRFDGHLQDFMFRRVVWRERPSSKKHISIKLQERYDVCKYVDWLIRHQAGVTDFEKLWSDGWIEVATDNPYTRLPIGVTMVPTIKWALPTTYNFM